MQQTNLPLSNVPEYSVSDLAFSLKKTLEDRYGRVRVRGELGRLTFHSSGHLYGTLKDDKANLDLICWRSSLSTLSVRPEEGLEVICTGKISTYPQRSNYQFIIDTMELAGEGALLKMLEQRKKALAAEGLFAPERKKSLPFLPQKIGVITSPTGAVIRDILHRLKERFPTHVMLWPVRVQGDTAAQAVVTALQGFQGMAADLRPDVLILARGGGSLEDLMPFNDEAVVRAVANCTIPIITAVGHEIDTTLVDYAADLRAPTPTGAAEQAVPVRAQLIAQVMDVGERLRHAAYRKLEHTNQRLTALRLADPKNVLDLKTQQLDHVIHKLQSRYEKYIAMRRERLGMLAAKIRHPRAICEEKARILKIYNGQLERIRPVMLKQKTQQLDIAARMLESLSFKSVLARGYAVVRRKENGHAVSNPDQVKSGEALELLFKDDAVLDVIAEKGRTS
jgi:exodeoxyribonuclease VII large subunit